MPSVKYAVIPVGGLGTRFLPATKAVAKELLPVGGRPVIQYAVEECHRAGIEQVVLVSNRLKNSLIDHLERDEALEKMLLEMGKADLLPLVRDILPEPMSLINIRQSSPRGLGDAILCARPVLGREPFAVLLPDDVLLQPSGEVSDVLKRMIDLHEQLNCSVVGVEEVPMDRVSSYGIIEPADEPVSRRAVIGPASRKTGIEPASRKTGIGSASRRAVIGPASRRAVIGPASRQAGIEPASRKAAGYRRVRSLIEKPEASQAPSNIAVVGRYVFMPEVLDHLATVEEDAGGEIQLTPAISSLTPEVVACDLACRRYDCGSRSGFLLANIVTALQDPKLVSEVRSTLEAVIAAAPEAGKEHSH